MAINVLITGASGFIGQHLVAAMRNAGFAVRAAGRRPSYFDDVDWVPLSHVEAFDWHSICSDVDLVVHLAAVAHTRGVSSHELQQVNKDSAVSLAKALRPNQRFIFVSSIRAVVGPSSSVEITEDTIPNPSCTYGHFKLQAEEEIKRIHESTCILRPVTVYGHNAKHNIARLASLAFSGLPMPVKSFTAPRSYLSIENLCSTVIHVAKHKCSGVYHISDPDIANLCDVVGWFRDAIGKPHRVFAAPKSAIAVLGFFPSIKSFLKILEGPLEARPVRLLGEGWKPIHPSSFHGVHAWAAKEFLGRRGDGKLLDKSAYRPRN